MKNIRFIEMNFFGKAELLPILWRMDGKLVAAFTFPYKMVAFFFIKDLK
jgi:hypothetical protein